MTVSKWLVLLGCLCLIMVETSALGQAPKTLGRAPKVDGYWAKYKGGHPLLFKKHNGRLVFSDDAIMFFKGRDELFTIRYANITAVSADKVARRRVEKTDVVDFVLLAPVSIPLFFILKGKTRHLLIEHRDEKNNKAGAILWLVKNKQTLRILTLVAEKAELVRQEEKFYARPAEANLAGAREKTADKSAAELKAPKEDQQQCEVRIASTPEGADVELNGKFVGTTPTTLRLLPGEYSITIRKSGFRPWQRTLFTIAGNDLRIAVELEPQDE